MYKQTKKKKVRKKYSGRKKKTKMALENNVNKLISTHVMNGDFSV